MFRCKRPIAGGALVLWCLMALACAAAVVTIDTKGGVFVTDSSLEVEAGHAGTTTDPHVLKATGGTSIAGPGSSTDLSIPTWSGTAGDTLSDNPFARYDSSLGVLTIEDPSDPTTNNTVVGTGNTGTYNSEGNLTGSWAGIPFRLSGPWWTRKGVFPFSSDNGIYIPSTIGPVVEFSIPRLNASSGAFLVGDGSTPSGAIAANAGTTWRLLQYSDLPLATDPGLEDSSGLRVKVSGPVTRGASGISVQDASTSQKGAASFNSTFFTVSSGAVSLANGAVGNTQLATGLSPRFATRSVADAALTITTSDHLISWPIAGTNRAATLPDSGSGDVGMEIVIFKTGAGAGTGTINRSGSDLINGATSVVIPGTTLKGVRLLCLDTTNWIAEAIN